MPKKDVRRLLASALLGEQDREEAETKSSASPLDIAIAKHKLRHEAFCDEFERRLNAATRFAKPTIGQITGFISGRYGNRMAMAMAASRTFVGPCYQKAGKLWLHRLGIDFFGGGCSLSLFPRRQHE